MYLVYILKSLKDNHLYIGRTNNIKRRLAEHNRGAVSATKYRMPFILLKTIETESEMESVRLEREYKKGYKREEIKREFGL
ncbi:MAG: GIY-YIG nuclease family protein [Patescibacteria group bacterium]